MNSGSSYKPKLYPAFTFSASPTYFAWVKITAADIQCLRAEPGFEGQGLYFHLNHPIRYVSITAPIVAIEDLFSKYVLLTLDDGSGATIGVKVKRLPKEIADRHRVELSSNTTVTNLSVSSSLGTYDVSVDGQLLDIGTVIKIKASIETWRDTKQLDLKRVRVVRDTTEEMKEWLEVAKWKDDVLRRPWYLGRRKLQELQAREDEVRDRKAAELRKMEQRERARAEKRREREARHRERAQLYEMRRRKEDVMMNAGSLV